MNTRDVLIHTDILAAFGQVLSQVLRPVLSQVLHQVDLHFDKINTKFNFNLIKLGFDTSQTQPLKFTLPQLLDHLNFNFYANHPPPTPTSEPLKHHPQPC